MGDIDTWLAFTSDGPDLYVIQFYGSTDIGGKYADLNGCCCDRV